MSFREFLEEATIYRKFNPVGSSLIKEFDYNETKKIIAALKANPNYSKIKSVVADMESSDDYSEEIAVELEDGTKFVLYARDGILRMGGDSAGFSKRYEIAAIDAEQLISELPQAKIK